MGGDEMDYYEIGQRIRKFRKARGLSQEQLAEKIGISTTHMSHIETGSTKLSLITLVSIANSLCVGIDQLLGTNINLSTHSFVIDIQELIEDCNSYELNAMIEAMRLVKTSIRNKPNNPNE